MIIKVRDVSAASAVLIDARRRQTYDLRLVHLLNVEVRAQLLATYSMGGGKGLSY
jgi:hypothetical protein